MISDEKLSAFLDAELPEAEMEIIREQLIDDENLANRMAELAMVDELVAMSYSTIDARPIPASIAKLLADEEPGDETKTAQIIAFPLLKKIRKTVQQHAAIAASVALVIGFGIAQSLHLNTNNTNDWQAVASVLNSVPSGVEQLSTTGVTIKPRLTFTNKAGEFCRQFIMSDKNSASENIACYKDNQWQLAATVYLESPQQTGTYQTASGGSLLDTSVEQMASGDFFNAQEESAAIEQHWSSKK